MALIPFSSFPTATTPLSLTDILVGLQAGANIKTSINEVTKVMYQDIQTLSGTTKTLALADIGAWIRATSGSATAITVPPNSSVAFPIGIILNGVQGGAGQITLTAGAGVTLNYPSDLGVKTRHQGSSWRLIKVATDIWDLTGDIAA